MKKLIRTKDIGSSFPPQQHYTTHIVCYEHRDTHESGTEKYWTFCLDAAIWLFMQDHNPLHYKVTKILREHRPWSVNTYNSIGVRLRLSELKQKPFLTFTQEEEVSRLTKEKNSTYCPHDYLDFEHEFTWIEEEMT